MKIIRSEKKADAQYIHDRLYEYNLSKTGAEKQEIILDDDPTRCCFLVLSEEEPEQCLGGVVFHLDGTVCKVDFLWLSEELRGKGMGFRLIEKVKEEAAELDCSEITLFTSSYQAPGFYPKAGFTLARKKEGVLAGEADTFYYRFVLRK